MLGFLYSLQQKIHAAPIPPPPKKTAPRAAESLCLARGAFLFTNYQLLTRLQKHLWQLCRRTGSKVADAAPQYCGAGVRLVDEEQERPVGTQYLGFGCRAEPGRCIPYVPSHCRGFGSFLVEFHGGFLFDIVPRFNRLSKYRYLAKFIEFINAHSA